VTEGVLRPCTEDTGHLCYRLFEGKNILYVSVRLPDTTESHLLDGAVVRIKGVVTGKLDANGRRQMFSASLKDIEVQSPPLDKKLPPRPARGVSADEANVSLVRQVHIHGRILWRSGEEFLVQDASGAIFVRTATAAPLQTGDTVDAVGFPAHGEFGLELADAEMHLGVSQASAISIAPLRLTAEEILKGGFDERRVTLKGRVVGQVDSGTRTIYQLREDGVLFNVLCPHEKAGGQNQEIARGSTVEVTGVALLPGTGKGAPERLTILIQAGAEMVPRSEDSWLTWQRALAILGAMAICLLVPLFWVKQLRRTVRRQTALIREGYESKLQLEARFRRVIERSLSAVYTVSSEGAILECNAAFANMLGMSSREELIGRFCQEFEAKPGEMASLGQAIRQDVLNNLELSMRRDDGEIVHLMMNVTPVETPDGKVYETTAIDITQLRQNQAELQQARDKAVFDSLNDALTGLPNRRYLQEVLPILVEKAEARNEVLALLFIDLDGFKQVNDSLGHDVGDGLLRQVAVGMRSMVRAEDTLARLGGDEFMVILNDIRESKNAITVADGLLKVIAQPQRVDGHMLNVGASIGISLYPADSTHAEELIRQADSAMYAAKRAGKHRIVRYLQEAGVLSRSA
jgi:diguanylate cyclase (GGDEF)-like protein/PAS domain S-box-containing protein